jgi:hypothetical protein
LQVNASETRTWKGKMAKMKTKEQSEKRLNLVTGACGFVG